MLFILDSKPFHKYVWLSQKKPHQNNLFKRSFLLAGGVLVSSWVTEEAFEQAEPGGRSAQFLAWKIWSSPWSLDPPRYSEGLAAGALECLCLSSLLCTNRESRFQFRLNMRSVGQEMHFLSCGRHVVPC